MPSVNPPLPRNEDLEALAADILFRTGLVLETLANAGMPLAGPNADAKNLLVLQLMSVIIPMALGEDPRKNVEQLVQIGELMDMTKVRALLNAPQY